MITLSFEQAWTVFLAVCSGLGLFGWLVYWLSGQFTAVRSLIHEKYNHLDRRVNRLEWHSNLKSIPDDENA